MKVLLTTNTGIKVDFLIFFFFKEKKGKTLDKVILGAGGWLGHNAYKCIPSIQVTER